MRLAAPGEADLVVVVSRVGVPGGGFLAVVEDMSCAVCLVSVSSCSVCTKTVAEDSVLSCQRQSGVVFSRQSQVSGPNIEKLTVRDPDFPAQISWLSAWRCVGAWVCGCWENDVRRATMNDQRCVYERRKVAIAPSLAFHGVCFV